MDKRFGIMVERLAPRRVGLLGAWWVGLRRGVEFVERFVERFVVGQRKRVVE